MIPLKEIEICKADAINYYKGEDKDFLHKIFFNDDQFKKALERKIFFLIGDKGTGKTAFAVYNTNNETNSLRTSLKFTSETDFKKFIRLINAGKINISDFVNVWKVILLLLISQEIEDNIDENLISKYFLLTKIDKAIEKYYRSAFSPEITNAIELFDKQEVFLEIIRNFNAKIESSEKIEKTGFQIDLLEIEKDFIKALTDLNLKKSFILFIDGTDQIPFDVKRTDYEECLRGLANAIWDLNQLIFPEIINSRVQFVKIVLLIRPDIFSKIRFHNANAKIKDNSVILDWTTSESHWRNSILFKTVDNLLASQQKSKFALGYSWNEYFDEFFDIPAGGRIHTVHSFIAILRRTFMRPRDVFVYLDLLFKEANNRNLNKITSEVFNCIQTSYSRYLLGEIKDQFNFFHEETEWEVLIDYFKYLDGKVRFDYKYFVSSFDKFLLDFPETSSEIFEKPEVLLQELYSNNIICYIEETEDEDFFKWAYREKNYTNLYPMVVFDCEYQFHPGLLRSIGVGKTIHKRNSNY
jgi:hypothetical protein